MSAELKENDNNFLNDNFYKKVNKDINNWPKWKKKAYNETFATSKHAKKLKLN